MLCTELGCKAFEGQSPRAGRGESTSKQKNQTWMLSRSDLQASILTVSGWLGTRTVERDFPPKIRETGDPTELAYSRPCICLATPSPVRRDKE
jgi:hypothetical protein